LRDLACGADHVLVGRVIAVGMIDSRGRAVRNEKARTGPGLKNTIRLEVEVLEVVESTETSVPTSILVPLDPFMHYSLGQIRAAHAEPSDAKLVFLRGPEFEPIIAGKFLWHLNSRGEVLVLRKECRP